MNRWTRARHVLTFCGFLLALPACFRDPDVEKMKCTPVKGCPEGYSCVPMEGTLRCQRTIPTGADSSVAESVDVSLAADVRLDVPGRESAGLAEVSSVTLDVRTHETADVPMADAEPVVNGTGGSFGLGGSNGRGGAIAGTGGFGGVSGRGGATLRDAGTAGSPGSGGVTTRDGSPDVPLGTGGAGAGGHSGVGGVTGTGGSPGTGGAGTGGAGTGGAPGTGGSSACSLGGAAGANTLSIDVDGAQTVIGKEIFGVLMERLGRQFQNGGLFVGTDSTIPHTNGMRNDVIDGLKEAGVGLIQFPGGCAANSYNWSANTNPPSDVGTDRFIQLCNLVGAEPYITGKPNGTDAASNAAWVDYIQGLPEGHLKYFKVGNAVWGGCGAGQTEAAYETSYSANYDRLQGKNLFLVAGGDLIGKWAWYNTMLANIGSKIDGIEVQDYLYFAGSYSSINFTEDQYYNVVHLANTGQIRPHVEQVVAILNTHDPAGRIKIVLDEWGDWLTQLDGETWMQQNTVMDAISAAEQLHIIMAHADRIQIAALAQAINVMHSLFLVNTSQVLVKTPTFYIFKMFVPHHTSGAKWAPNTLVSENITANGATFPVLSAGATADSSGRVNISLANVDLVNTRSVQITLTSSKTSYVVSSAQIVTGSARNTYNDFGQPENVSIQPLPAGNYSICGRSLNVTLPAKSVVMLGLNPQ